MKTDASMRLRLPSSLILILLWEQTGIIPVHGSSPTPSVNDLGGDSHGGGHGSQAADEVVHQIKQEGGVAVPNYGRPPGSLVSCSVWWHFMYNNASPVMCIWSTREQKLLALT